MRAALPSFTLLVCFFVVAGVLAVIAARAHMLQAAHAESFTADSQDVSAETSFCMDDVCVTRRQLAMLQELSQDPSAACGSIPKRRKPAAVPKPAPAVPADEIASVLPYEEAQVDAEEEDYTVPAVEASKPPAVTAPVASAAAEAEDKRSAWRREFDARLATMTPEQRKAEWAKVTARKNANAGASGDVEGFTSSSFLPSIDLYRYAA